MTHFEENARYFEKKNPRATALLSLVDTSHLELCRTGPAQSELNVRDKRRAKDGYFHSEKSVKQEMLDWARSIEILDTIDLLIIYGVGFGYALSALESWLQYKPEKKVIFLEDDLSLISCFFETELAGKLLKNPQVYLYYVENTREGIQTLEEVIWGTYPTKITYTALPFYEETKKEYYKQIGDTLFALSANIHDTLDEYIDHGLPYFRNFWENLFQLPNSFRANLLFNKFKDIPAVIVGAGPSLNKQLPLLRTLQDRALIFAGGSAINALTDAGISPHFAGSIDPNPTQYLRLRQNLGFEIPFFFRHRVEAEGLKLISGPKLYLTGGDGYNTQEWFEKRFKIHGGVLGGGHSVSNFLLEAAHALGSRTIILIGMDLAYTGDKPYATGVVEDTDIHHQAVFHESNVTWHDFEGKPITTLWKWLVEANWISDFKMDHPRLGLVNATEGGIGIDGVPNEPFADVVAKHAVKSLDLMGLIHAEIYQAGKIEAGDGLILEGMALFYDSLTQSVEYIDALLLEANKKKNKAFNLLEMASIIHILSALQAEISYQYLLEVFDRMRVKLDFYRLLMFSHPTRKAKELIVTENELISSRYHFLKEVAMMNQLLIAKTIQRRNREGRDVEAFRPKSKLIVFPEAR